MPPKPKITKEMVIDAALEIARETGWENINARTVSNKLNCSTHPVMYHFATIEELKLAAFERTDQFHMEYLMNVSGSEDEIMLGIGLNYIRFAVDEPNLFRFLFQSGYAEGNSLLEMINSERLMPVLSAMQQGMNLGLDQTKEVFITLAMFVHGYASIIANNSLAFDEKLIAKHLKRVCTGAILAIQEEISCCSIPILLSQISG